MYTDPISQPVPMGSPEFYAQESEGSRATLAAYLLLAGCIFIEGINPEGEEFLVPDEQLEEIRIHRYATERLSFGQLSLADFIDRSPSELRALAEVAAKANETGDPYLAAEAIVGALKSEDDLIWVCALGSAIEFFKRSELEPEILPFWSLARFFYRPSFNPSDELVLQLLHTILARFWPNPASGASMSLTTPPQQHQTGAIGLVAVHGTVLPFRRSNRPEWSVPNTGKLFAHIRKLRPDIYAKQDYYRWEGGYTDYAREVASLNLHAWISSHNLSGTDVVAHSHGCNVVMGSARLGSTFGKTLLMNCPVHWAKYYLTSGEIAAGAISVRINFDFVILADRARQRFPKNTIPEVILPLWYTSHSALTQVSTWATRNVDQYLT